MTLLNELRNNYNSDTGATLYEMYKHFRIKNTSIWNLQSKYDLSVRALSVFPNNILREMKNVFVFCNLADRWHESKLKTRIWNAINAVDDEIITCSDCGSINYRDDSIYVDSRSDFVGDCCRDNYIYHEGHDEYYHEDEYPEEEEDRYGVYPYDYDVTQQLDFQSTNNETRYISTEIETERRNDCPSDIVHDIHNTMSGFALCKHDGSLENGFEIVTAPATLSVHKDRWSKFCEKNYADNLSSWNTATCGMHVHVDRASLTPLDIGKLLVFVNGKRNAGFMQKIAGRDSRQWSARKFKRVKDALNRSDKYEALATHKPKTIEFRIFKGNIAKRGILRNLEFVDALCNFVGTVGMDRDTDTVNRLSYTNFIEYMNTSENKGTYPYLFSWLVRKGYNKGNTKRLRTESEEY
tara:strand:- start:5754 stop:6980 length:1227 start_codon:yes stop_codon:yes gene_type:complete